MTDESTSPSAYDESGVPYNTLDALKRFAQAAAIDTSDNLPVGMSDVGQSRGESARVIDIGPFYLAAVQEGLGTKNLVADAYAKQSDRTWYDAVGYDTVATIVNDLITVGARPLMINAHWAMGSAQVLKDSGRGEDLVGGWKRACNDAGAVYGGGETALLKGVVFPETIELSGSAVGIIDPKERLVLGDRIKAGDHIILVESSGIHANGLTLVRDIAENRLPHGYQTVLPSGIPFGQKILRPAHIYSHLYQSLVGWGTTVHYMVHITGHGWRKLMRANGEFTYRMHTVPPPQEEFKLIQQTRAMTDEDMYQTFNMGAGFAFMVPEQQAQSVRTIAQALNLQTWDAGVVEEGPKQVVIEPLNITYTKDSLKIR